jgi:hypothetical protein
MVHIPSFLVFFFFFFFFLNTVATMCVFKQLTACCLTRWLMLSQLLVAFVIHVNLWHFLHPFTFLCLCISVPVVNQLLVSSSYCCQFIVFYKFLSFITLSTSFSHFTVGHPHHQWHTKGGGLGGSNPPSRNSEILTKYQKLRKFYYKKWNSLYQITASSRTPD